MLPAAGGASTRTRCRPAIETAPAKMDPAASRVAARTQISPADATMGQSARERRRLVRSRAPSDEINGNDSGGARPEP